VGVLRLVNLVLLVTVLTATTSAGRLATGLELLLSPLNAARLPGHQLALVGGIALSFLPTVGDDLSTIMAAQASRGLASAERNRWRWLAQARAVAQAIVPLFAGVFRRADEMTEAMLARCYQGGRGRTHLAALALGSADWLAITVCLAVLLAVVVSGRYLGA
jgi:energy-coupling factor transport system permease protein